MKMTIVVKTNARKEGVERLEDGSIRVSVNAPPQEGRANEAVIRVIAEHFAVAKSKIRIVGGLRSKKKVIEVCD